MHVPCKQEEGKRGKEENKLANLFRIIHLCITVMFRIIIGIILSTSNGKGQMNMDKSLTLTLS